MEGGVVFVGEEENGKGREDGEKVRVKKFRWSVRSLDWDEYEALLRKSDARMKGGMEWERDSGTRTEKMGGGR